MVSTLLGAEPRKGCTLRRKDGELVKYIRRVGYRRSSLMHKVEHPEGVMYHASDGTCPAGDAFTIVEISAIHNEHRSSLTASLRKEVEDLTKENLALKRRMYDRRVA